MFGRSDVEVEDEVAELEVRRDFSVTVSAWRDLHMGCAHSAF